MKASDWLPACSDSIFLFLRIFSLFNFYLALKICTLHPKGTNPRCTHSSDNPNESSYLSDIRYRNRFFSKNSAVLLGRFHCMFWSSHLQHARSFISECRMVQWYEATYHNRLSVVYVLVICRQLLEKIRSSVSTFFSNSFTVMIMNAGLRYLNLRIHMLSRRPPKWLDCVDFVSFFMTGSFCNYCY